MWCRFAFFNIISYSFDVCLFLIRILLYFQISNDNGRLDNNIVVCFMVCIVQFYLMGSTIHIFDM